MNILNESWYKLVYFETKDLVERRLIAKHGRKPSARVIQEVTSNFVQGREYFNNANRSSIVVKPLLQYYGVLSLCRGLILASDTTKSESQLKPSHGLEVRNWQEAIKAKNYTCLELRITEGTFSELLRSTNNKSYFRANSTAVNWGLAYKVPEVKTKVKLIEVCRSLPDLSAECSSWTEDKISYGYMETLLYKNLTETEIKLTGVLSDDIVEQLFPSAVFPQRRMTSTQSNTLVYIPHGQLPFLSQRWHGPFNIGDVTVVPPLTSDIGLNQISMFFLLSYTFGMMARYFPSTWISLTRGDKGDAIYPLVIRSMNLVEELLPKIILDFLEAPFKFEE